MAREENTRCLQCGAELQDRYKGSKKIYCSSDCRKTWTLNNPGKNAREESKKIKV